MNRLIYTGVGSRITPKDIRVNITKLSAYLENLGYFLRTGDAPGADYHFSLGVSYPWNRKIYRRGSQTEKSVELMLKVHPSPKNAILYVNTLGRNPLQVLGDKLDDPSEFLVCWTPRGIPRGGTATTIRVARLYKVPVFNLYKTSFSDVMKYAVSVMESKCRMKM